MAFLQRIINSPLVSGDTNTQFQPSDIAPPLARPQSSAPASVADYLAAGGVTSNGFNSPWSQGASDFVPQFSSNKATAANQLFAMAIGGAGNPQGPWSSTRVDMGGVWHQLAPSDPRYTANSYQYNYPNLFADYKAGTITGSQLFSRAISQTVQDELAGGGDQLNNSNFNFSAPPRVHFNFTSSGGGSISGTGISFGGLRGTWTGGSTRSFNFGF